MVEDGLDVEEPSPFDLLPLREWNSVSSVPTLKLLTHVAIYNEKEKLQDIASTALPRILSASVEDFLKARETREYVADNIADGWWDVYRKCLFCRRGIERDTE